jgi:hypothetical protein
MHSHQTKKPARWHAAFQYVFLKRRPCTARGFVAHEQQCQQLQLLALFGYVDVVQAVVRFDFDPGGVGFSRRQLSPPADTSSEASAPE